MKTNSRTNNRTTPRNRRARVAVLAAALALAGVAVAAPRQSQNHVPASLADVRPFYAVAAKHPHIALVNVAGAIPEDAWRLAATYAASRLQINIWTNAIPASVTARLVDDPAYTAQAVGNPNAKIGVFFERRGGKGCKSLSAPGAWAVLDVSAVEAGAPDPQTLRDRYAKLVLKGLAEAVGGGATLEPFCAMFYGSQSVEGMDKTNITLAPMCYFPMLEILRQIGGMDMTRAAQSEEE